MRARQIRDLEINIHNKPLNLGPYVPVNWNHRDIVLAHALSSGCIGLVKEEDQSPDWKLAPVIEKVTVWRKGLDWYVQLSESLFRFYNFIQPEMEVTITTSPMGKSVLLHTEWKSLSVEPQ